MPESRSDSHTNTDSVVVYHDVSVAGFMHLGKINEPGDTGKAFTDYESLKVRRHCGRFFQFITVIRYSHYSENDLAGAPGALAMAGRARLR